MVLKAVTIRSLQGAFKWSNQSAAQSYTRHAFRRAVRVGGLRVAVPGPRASRVIFFGSCFFFCLSCALNTPICTNCMGPSKRHRAVESQAGLFGIQETSDVGPPLHIKKKIFNTPELSIPGGHINDSSWYVKTAGRCTEKEGFSGSKANISRHLPYVGRIPFLCFTYDPQSVVYTALFGHSKFCVKTGLSPWYYTDNTVELVKVAVLTLTRGKVARGSMSGFRENDSVILRRVKIKRMELVFPRRVEVIIPMMGRRKRWVASVKEGGRKRTRVISPRGIASADWTQSTWPGVHA